MRDDLQPVVPTYHLFAAGSAAAVKAGAQPWHDGSGFGFRDILDAINPLQHLPVISTIYRWLTGDTIGAIPRIIGDALYGGPIGFVAGLADAEVKAHSGEDLGEHVVALLGGHEVAPAAVATADAGEAVENGRFEGGGPAGLPPAKPLIAQAPAAEAPKKAPPAIAAANPPGIPLHRAAPANTDPAAAFLAHRARIHRELAAEESAIPPRILNNHPIPLEGVSLPARFSGAALFRRATVTAPSAPTDPAPGNPPIDISQRMMDALDKYARMQKKRDGERGDTIDLSR